ncbi:sec-independent protein translocase protein TatA [Gammaproteobacteria bacterium]
MFLFSFLENQAMGIGGVNIWQLLILLLVIVLVFGTNKLRTIGADLGNAIKGFRHAMRETDEAPATTEKKTKSAEANVDEASHVIEGQVDPKNTSKT